MFESPHLSSTPSLYWWWLQVSNHIHIQPYHWVTPIYYEASWAVWRLCIRVWKGRCCHYGRHALAITCATEASLKAQAEGVQWLLLECRLLLWAIADEILEILKEGNCIQHHLVLTPNCSRKNNCGRTFAIFMTKGKVKHTIHTLSCSNRRGVLNLSDTVTEGLDWGKSLLDILRDKHSSNQPPFLKWWFPRWLLTVSPIPSSRL